MKVMEMTMLAGDGLLIVRRLYKLQIASWCSKSDHTKAIKQINSCFICQNVHLGMESTNPVGKEIINTIMCDNFRPKEGSVYYELRCHCPQITDWLSYLQLNIC